MSDDDEPGASFILARMDDDGVLQKVTPEELIAERTQPGPEPGDFPEIWVGKDEDGVWQAVIDMPPVDGLLIGSGYVQLGTGEDIGDPREKPGWTRVIPPRQSEPWQRVQDLLASDEGHMVLAHNEDAASVQPWTAVITMGREAEDSDMAAAQGWGFGQTPDEALDEVLREYRR